MVCVICWSWGLCGLLVMGALWFVGHGGFVVCWSWELCSLLVMGAL